MFIETKYLKKAEEYLNLKYSSASKNKLTNIKYEHMIDCLNILKFYNLLNYLSYGSAVLLHDIGRFYESESKVNNFDHAKYGYKLLKKDFTTNPIILLPIKYHEEDLKWKTLLYNDKDFLNCSKFKKKKIIKCCMLVRDIDIISNMKNLIVHDFKDEKVNHINKQIIQKLYNGKISTKEEIYSEYDEISYILCGLNLLSFRKSFRYIKKYKIVDALKNKQLKMISDNQIYDSTIAMYEFIKIKYKL